MFALHCNKCYRRKKLEPTCEFYVSRCGHILCKSCIAETCPECSKPFTGVPVNNEMPLAMLDYFGEPLKLLSHFQKVTKFQYDQEKSLVIHMITSNDKTEKEVKDAQRNYNQIHESLQRKLEAGRERVQKYEEYIAYYERRLEQSRYMAPPITAQPKPRYPARKVIGDSTSGSSSAAAAVDFMPRLTQSIKSKFPGPCSTTISSNDGNSLLTEDFDISGIAKQMSISLLTPPPPPARPKSRADNRKNTASFLFPK